MTLEMNGLQERLNDVNMILKLGIGDGLKSQYLEAQARLEEKKIKA